MDIELTTGDPSDTQTGLTEGGFYTVLADGGVSISAEVDTDEFVRIAHSEYADIHYIPVLPGTKLKFDLVGDGPTKLRLTESA